MDSVSRIWETVLIWDKGVRELDRRAKKQPIKQQPYFKTRDDIMAGARARQQEEDLEAAERGGSKTSGNNTNNALAELGHGVKSFGKHLKNLVTSGQWSGAQAKPR